MRLFLMLVVLLMVQYKTFGQCWNPDSDSNGFINTSDLLSFLGVFDSPYNSPCDTISPQYNACVNQSFLEYNGYVYNLISIGEQCWFAENLRTIQYRNGDGIELVTSNDTWSNTSYGAFSFVNSDYYATYGILYNGHAVDDPRHLCPTGWHVPTDGDWMELEVALDMSFDEVIETDYRGINQGDKLKASLEDLLSWDGTNSYGFSALPGGYRSENVDGNFVNSYAYFWSSTARNGSNYSWYRKLESNNSTILKSFASIQLGFSVRCVKD